uniref:Uncharacterized protein n=1 Tax=Salix viminalis TaxID=40686 RepID=A0A6N2NCJ7_SALVM
MEELISSVAFICSQKGFLLQASPSASFDASKWDEQKFLDPTFENPCGCLQSAVEEDLNFPTSQTTTGCISEPSHTIQYFSPYERL